MTTTVSVTPSCNPLSLPPSLPCPVTQIGRVIRNPEVQALVPSLLAAIAEPNVHTRACLDVLLQVGLPLPLPLPLSLPMP